MARPICDLVSHVFYDGELKVAADAQNDEAWQSQRSIRFADIGPEDQVCLAEVAEDGVWSQAYHGPIRYGSADLISSMIKRALDQGDLDSRQLIVLTPFRAQRALLRQRLSAHGVSRVKVSTVHRAQGSEAPVVIFDPVDGANAFLLTVEAMRLMNVALSRAQAKIVLVVSPGDAANPVISQIINRTRLHADVRPFVPIAALVNRPGFPNSAVGKRVSIGRHTGEVSRASADGSMLWMLNADTGAEQAFDVSTIRRNAAPFGRS